MTNAVIHVNGHTVAITGDRADVIAGMIEDSLISLNESDRRAGAAERYADQFMETLAALQKSRSKMKQQLGYDENTSFDVVWNELINERRRNLEILDDVLESARALDGYITSGIVDRVNQAVADGKKRTS